jgi:phosphohistidine phosphatase SixA
MKIIFLRHGEAIERGSVDDEQRSSQREVKEIWKATCRLSPLIYAAEIMWKSGPLRKYERLKPLRS